MSFEHSGQFLGKEMWISSVFTIFNVPIEKIILVWLNNWLLWFFLHAVKRTVYFCIIHKGYTL